MSHEIREGLKTETGWELIETKYQRDQAINSGSLFMMGNGYLGYRGTFAEDTKADYTGCFVTDTWDNADGKWEEVCNVPNALSTRLFVDGEEITVKTGGLDGFKRKLNLENGVNTIEYTKTLLNGKKVSLREEKFASLANIHHVLMRYSFSVSEEADIKLITGIDGDVWDLNGRHLNTLEKGLQDSSLFFSSETREKGQKIDIVETVSFAGDNAPDMRIEEEKDRIFRHYTFKISKDQPFIMEKGMIIYHSNDVEAPFNNALNDAKKIDFDGEKQLSVKEWKEKWNRYDVLIEGNILDQVALRFNTYQSVIATPTHDTLPVGARGLSCQAYQGAAFWDQEIFNLPMYLYTDPHVCRNILNYRYKTLDGARGKARRLGYEGAYYAWISGKTGKELCPDFFFKDVITGRPIRNHFNDWQIHISPDIAYTIWLYYRVSADWAFIVKHGAEIIVEIARFLSSHAVYKPRKDRYEFVKVQGPDEYHENVDNNAFTNYQASFTMETATTIIKKMKKDNPAEYKVMKEKIELEDWEITLFEDMKSKIYTPEPDKAGIIEQFDGYSKLERVIPVEKIKERLIKEDEYYGWPNGIAVFTQAIKQADVIQLLNMHPSHFDKEIIRKNYDYYEPRTLHFSSLSPSAYSLTAARIGYTEEAHKNFVKSVNIDLKNTNEPISGGTFIGGIHTAAAGAAWQMATMGFMGLGIDENGIPEINPALPDVWKSVAFFLNFRGNEMRISSDNKTVWITVYHKVSDKLRLKVCGARYELIEGINEISI